MLEKDIQEVLFSEEQLQNRIAELGAELSSANAAGQAPDGWTDTCEAIVALSGSIEPLSNTSRVLIYLKDAEEGSIYLTACDGASMYDAFSAMEVPDYNPPTISLEEFNQISTGMTPPFPNVGPPLRAMYKALARVPSAFPPHFLPTRAKVHPINYFPSQESRINRKMYTFATSSPRRGSFREPFGGWG